jgi:copper homeostasis protein
MTLVEVAVTTLHSALAAERAGAHRLELCAALMDGGITPSAGLITAVAEQIEIPVFLLVRPRGGGFVYSNDELAVMRRDIEFARGLGIAGVVTGVLHPDHQIDVERTRILAEAAGALPVTFHRAFDLTRNLPEALEQLVQAGVSRVLTSGGAASALKGAEVIRTLVDKAADRVRVVAGGGIRSGNVREVITRTRVTEVHTGVSALVGTGEQVTNPRIRLRKAPPDVEGAWEEVDEAHLRRLMDTVRSHD